MRPSLFSYATRELSQDAVLAWLLAWAHPGHASESVEMHEVGRRLIEVIFSKAGRAVPELESVSVETQRSGIDIFAKINNEIALVVEDKIDSREHSDQLRRYLEVVHGWGHSPQNTVAIYIRTGDQDDLEPVSRAGYHLMNRADLLALLEGEVGRRARKGSDTLDDFARHLRSMEDAAISYLTHPLADWQRLGRGWLGFFARLRQELGAGGWGYVPNANGGFHGFWWGAGGDHPTVNPYMQLEETQLCFKIHVPNPVEFRGLRSQWHELFVEIGRDHGLNLVKPTRFGSGHTMTVAIMRDDYRVARDDGRLDLQATIAQLHLATTVLAAAVATRQEPCLRAEA